MTGDKGLQGIDGLPGLKGKPGKCQSICVFSALSECISYKKKILVSVSE